MCQLLPPQGGTGWALFGFYAVFSYFAGELLGAYGYRTCHELGDVVRAHEFAVILGMALGEFEGFREVSFAIEVCDVRTGEVAVGASAAEDNPASVAAPRVV